MDALSAETGGPAPAPVQDLPEHPAGATKTRRAPRVRPAPKPLPTLSEAYDHLTLDALRAYRAALQTEEGKVSYWRRILQARLDVVREGRVQGGTGTLDVRTLRPVLTDSRVTSGRQALVEVLGAPDIPPLPSLAELWERRVDPADPVQQEALEADLAAAERQLSDYRTALHGQLGEATGELIARYRANPLLCLTALPLAPSRGSVAS